MARVARLGIVVNDLDRTRLGWLGAWLIGRLLTGNPYTRIDAPLSVRRAYPAARYRTCFGRWVSSPCPRCVPHSASAMPSPPSRAGTSNPIRSAGSASANDISRCRDRGRGRWAGRGDPGNAACAHRARGRDLGARCSVAMAGIRRLTSPAAVSALQRAGLDEATLGAVARRIPAMRVETPGGTTFRLTYGTEAGGDPAVGFDRSSLDPALLAIARRAGAEVRCGCTVTAFDPVSGGLEVRGASGQVDRLRAEVVVGADGLRSIVATATSVARPSRLGPRIGLSYHLRDPDPAAVRDARMLVLDDGYVGIAPVAGGRVNVGIVLGRTWRAELARRGAAAVADGIVTAIPPTEEDTAAWRTAGRTDAVVGAWPLGHRVHRRAGPRWLLVGDAAGFLDPFTGEGLHRALISAELAAAAIHARATGHRRAFDATCEPCSAAS